MVRLDRVSIHIEINFSYKDFFGPIDIPKISFE